MNSTGNRFVFEDGRPKDKGRECSGPVGQEIAIPDALVSSTASLLDPEYNGSEVSLDESSDDDSFLSLIEILVDSAHRDHSSHKPQPFPSDNSFKPISGETMDDLSAYTVHSEDGRLGMEVVSS